MASMEESLCSYLLTKTAVTDLIGTSDNARLWPIDLPQTYELIDGAAAVYEIISSSEPHTISDRTGLVQSRVQISTFAADHAAAMALARAIKNCGVVAVKGSTNGTDFRGVTVEDGIRCYGERPTDGSGADRYIAEFDFLITYME